MPKRNIKTEKLTEREKSIKHINLMFEGLSDNEINKIGSLVLYLLLQEERKL